MPDRTTVDDAITRLARADSGRVIALLAQRFGDLPLADDVVQEALVQAVVSWRDSGVPDNPAAWLLTVARNRAIDRFRREQTARRRLLHAAPELTRHQSEEEGPDLITQDGEIPDERLRLMMLCCHPALDRDTQVALTLRLVGGLTTTEIAAAFLVPEPTLAQRIVRAKRKIRAARIPLTIPADPADRVAALTTVLLLIFNEAYLARGADDRVVRVDLAQEAIRLTAVARRLLPDDPEVMGLSALLRFQHSRHATRADSLGDLVLLEHQDRSRWDLTEIEGANAELALALRQLQPGPLQVQALIAAHHANARTADDTDWSRISSLYRQLLQMTGSGVVAVNHAVAVAMADGPRAGLALLAEVTGLDRYHLFHAARAELLLRDGRTADAAAAFEVALQLAVNPAERRHLQRRLSR